MVIVGAGIVGAERRLPPGRAGLAGHRGGRPGAAVGDRRLDLARARAASSSQRVATMTRLAQGPIALLDRSVEGSLLHPVGSIEVAPRPSERWAELHRRWAGRAPTGSRRALLDPAEVAKLLPLLDPDDDPRRLPRRRRRDRQGRARRRGDGRRRGRGAARVRRTARSPASTSRAGACAAWRPRRARSAPSTSSSRAGIWGPTGRRAGRRQHPAHARRAPVRLTAPLPELAGETREVVHPILRHQDHAMYFRQHADGYGDRQLPPRAARWSSPRPSAAGGDQPIALHAGGLRHARAEERARCCRRCATSSSRARSTG